MSKRGKKDKVSGFSDRGEHQRTPAYNGHGRGQWFDPSIAHHSLAKGATRLSGHLTAIESVFCDDG